jgi:hypothetical protein
MVRVIGVGDASHKGSFVGLLHFNPLANQLLKRRQRHGAVLKHRVMERADVETFAESLFRQRAQLADL